MVGRILIATAIALVSATAIFLADPDWGSMSIATISQTNDSQKPLSMNGRALYVEHCASCHGESLEGQDNWRVVGSDGTMPAPPHDETGHTWHHDDGLLFRYTKLGGARLMSDQGMTDFNSGMPGFADTMSDEQILAVLAYIKSTWPSEIQAIQAGRTRSQNGQSE